MPSALGGGELVAWRLDQASFAGQWDSGEGAWRAGGRWNSRGVRAVYASLDPATAILEVAVHKGFKALDIIPHVLTAALITDPPSVHVVAPDDVPDPDWLRPGIPSTGQQAFGDGLLARHPFVALPSTVSPHSWTLVFLVGRAGGGHRFMFQEPFILDPSLHSTESRRR